MQQVSEMSIPVIPCRILHCLWKYICRVVLGLNHPVHVFSCTSMARNAEMFLWCMFAHTNKSKIIGEMFCGGIKLGCSLKLFAEMTCEIVKLSLPRCFRNYLMVAFCRTKTFARCFLGDACVRTLSPNICRDVLWSPQAVRHSACEYLPRCLGKFALPTYLAQFLKDVQFACGECLLAVHANLGEFFGTSLSSNYLGSF